MDFDPKKNYYEILWVAEDASDEDIKKAFRKAAVKYHPDKPGGSKEKFQEINWAYQVIWDKQKRQQYDAFRKWGFTGFGWNGWFGNFGWFQTNGATFDFWDLWDLGDIVWNIFWWGFGWFWWGRNAARNGEDLRKKITITFDEAYLWVTKKISYTRKKVVEWAEKRTCDVCGWKWRTTKQVQSPFGVMQTQTTCPNCGWSGNLYYKDGKKLEDGGLQDTKEILEVKIPAWIKNDVFLKYSGKWDEWKNGMPSGNLYIQIEIQDNPYYTRQGDDIYVNLDVSIFDLVLWWEYEINHPTGKIKVKIPKWTQMDEKIKVAGKWFGSGWIFSKRWDLYVVPKVKIPKKLSKDEENLWKELQWMNK